MERTAKKIDKSMIISILKGSFIAIAISLVCILFFAFIIKLFGLGDAWLKPVNQAIKAVSILVGVFFGLGKIKDKGLVKGLIIGLIYTLLAFIVFSILNGSFCVDKTLLTDVLFGGIMGAICGVIFVNTKQNKFNK